MSRSALQASVDGQFMLASIRSTNSLSTSRSWRPSFRNLIGVEATWAFPLKRIYVGSQKFCHNADREASLPHAGSCFFPASLFLRPRPATTRPDAETNLRCAPLPARTDRTARGRRRSDPFRRTGATPQPSQRSSLGGGLLTPPS